MLVKSDITFDAFYANTVFFFSGMKNASETKHDFYVFIDFL